MAQHSRLEQFMNLKMPEKIWALTHPFILKKSFRITREARMRAAAAIYDPELDGNYNGGQVDVFRHSLWMALLSSEIRTSAARRLGIAHEKGNKIDFDEKNLEEGKLPSFIMTKMDLENNELGLKIGSSNKGSSSDEISKLIKAAILNGEGVIIKTDNEGRFLTEENRVIQEVEYIGKWYNPKTLVPSNYKFTRE